MKETGILICYLYTKHVRQIKIDRFKSLWQVEPVTQNRDTKRYRGHPLRITRRKMKDKNPSNPNIWSSFSLYLFLSLSCYLETQRNDCLSFNFPCLCSFAFVEFFENLFVTCKSVARHICGRNFEVLMKSQVSFVTYNKTEN